MLPERGLRFEQSAYFSLEIRKKYALEDASVDRRRPSLSFPFTTAYYGCHVSICMIQTQAHSCPPVLLFSALKRVLLAEASTCHAVE